MPDDTLVTAADTPAIADNTLVETLGLSDVPFTGQGVGIAVVDSGLAHSRDFDEANAGQDDFVYGGGAAVRSSDAYGHGTHVSGLIAGPGISRKRK